MLFFGGNNRRIASLVGGPIYSSKHLFVVRSIITGERRSCGALLGGHCTSSSEGDPPRGRKKLGRSLALPTCVFISQNANKDVYSDGPDLSCAHGDLPWHLARALDGLGSGVFRALGCTTGYLAGGMVAGVFLLADLLRQNFTRRMDEVAANF